MESADTALVLRTEAGEEDAPQALQTELQVNLVETRERLGIPDPDTPGGGVAELEHLKQILHEQEEAKLEALQTAAELHLQLANAHAETAKAKKQYYGVPKSRDTVTRVESELSEVRTQLHAAKKELDWEQRSRRAESIQAAARVKSLETELEAVKAATVDAQSGSSHRPLRIALGALAALAVAAGIALIAVHHQVPVSANDSVAVTDTASQRTPEGLPASLSRFAAPATGPDFTRSYDRLSEALAALPGRDPEDVLRQVQKAGKGCDLRWNNGEPSLLFGRQGTGDAKKPNTLEASLTQCAEAVEKLR